MSSEGLRQRVLGAPRGFDLFQRLVGARRSKANFVAKHVQPKHGDRILDLGCGTGAILELLPPGVEYVGVELDRAYVHRARMRFGDRATFVCSDLASYEPASTFDIVIAYGVLHHLDDGGVRSACRVAHRALREEARLLFAEPCRTDQQGWLATTLMNRDRGRYIRTPERYAELMSEQFEQTKSPQLAADDYRIPYTFVILEARR